MGTRLNSFQLDYVDEGLDIGAGCLMGCLGRVLVSQIPKLDAWIGKLEAELEYARGIQERKTYGNVDISVCDGKCSSQDNTGRSIQAIA